MKYNSFKYILIQVVVLFFLSINSVQALNCEGNFTQYPATGNAVACIPTTTTLPTATGQQVVTNVMLWITSIFGMLAIISFLVSGVQYFMAAGDTTAIEKAKRNTKYSIIGVIVGLSGYIMVYFVDQAMRANL